MITQTDEAPIGVVIPSFGHPQFLAEAITSACRQQIDRPVYIVVVDDGCRFPETGSLVNSLQREYAGNLFYFRQENTGLAGARNAGIRFLLDLFPDIDSIFFLDADNRLEPYSLAAYRKALGDDANVGWAYPDITFFGLTWASEGRDVRETAPVYDSLRHLMGNISEAGSLVRATVFRQGVLFDETMRYGLEDWDFWLSALEAGFVGNRTKDAGFLYRRRPESMLADARRHEKTLIDQIQRKHPKLFNPGNLIQLEHADAPPFAVVFTDENTVLLTGDPLAEGRLMSGAAFATLTRDWLLAAHQHFYPECILLLSRQTWEALRGQSIFVRWILWSIRCRTARHASVSFREGAELEPTLSTVPGQPDGAILAFSAKGFQQTILELHHGDETNLQAFKAEQGLDFRLPELPATQPADTGDFASALAYLKEFDLGGQQAFHASRNYSGPMCNTFRENLVKPICSYGGLPAFPALHDKPRVLLMATAASLPDASTQSLAAETIGHLQQCDLETVLLLECDGRNRLKSESLASFADIVPLYVPANEGGLHYYAGRRLRRQLENWQKEVVGAVARSADLVIVLGAPSSFDAVGIARGRHAKVITIVPPGGPDRDLGYLAYEHAEDRIVVENPGDGSRLAAMGVPEGKILAGPTLMAILETYLASVSAA